MQLKKNKLNLNNAIATMILVTSSTVFAVINNMEQLIHIESDIQFLDIQNNVLTFIGNVVVTHGLLKINADKIVITHLHSERNKEIINGYGNPIIFYQMQDNGRSVNGYALQMYYEPNNSYIVLTGNASITQVDSNISGYKITYLIKEQKIQVFSRNDKRVTTILTTSQLKKNEEITYSDLLEN